MKRTLISLGVILISLIIVVSWNLAFVSQYAREMKRELDYLCEAESYAEMKKAVRRMESIHEKNEQMAYCLIPAGKVEEIKTLLNKLNSYVETGDIDEIKATASELASRINLMYSVNLFHWYPKESIGIV